MPSDNTILSAPVGSGDTIRTLLDGNNIEWQAVVASYATTLSPGANVLQVVDASHGMPVAQQGTWNVGTVTSITNPVTVTQSGTWNIGTLSTITNVVHVDDNAGSLTVDGAVAATQSGTWDIATVTTLTGITNVVHVDDNSGSLTVDGTVTANQGTAAAGSGAWPITITNTSDTVVKPGDSVNNAIRVNVVAGGAGDGAILDGVSSSIKATVKNYTNSNPLTVRLTDTNGDYVAAGGGTQYTEDAPAAADPVGGAIIVVRDDSRAGSITSTNGDNIALRGTNAGEVYVKHVDTIAVTQSGTWNVATVTTVTSLSQWAGNAIDTNSGNKSAGTLRVVLATDQPQLTNKLLVTPDANSAVNVAQFGGGNVVTVATGVPKVGIADSAGAAFLSAANALNSTGGGVQAVQVVGQFDDVAPTAITENQFGNIRMSANRNVYQTIRDAAGNERGVNVTAANEMLVSVNNATLAVTQSGTWNVGTVTTVTSLTQFNGVAITLNKGASDAGTLRVALGDGTQTIGSLAANQSVNVAQVAGGTTSTVATGVQKVGTADSAGTAFLSAANALNSTGGGVQAVQLVGQFDDVSPTTITENQFGNVRMSNNRNVYQTIRDAAGNERGVNVTASNELLVNVNNTVTVGTHAVTQSGTWNVVCAGDVASGSADSGNPVKMGARAATAAPTAATDGQRVNVEADKVGRLAVAIGQIRDLCDDSYTTITSSTSETTIKAAVASTFIDVVSVLVNNTSATATRVDFRDTTGGSVRFSIYVPAGDVRGASFTRPVKQATVNTNWTAQCSASVADVRIFLQFEKNI